MSSTIFSKFSTDTLETIASSQLRKVPQTKKKMVTELKKVSDTAGVKELAFMLKNMELEDVCNRYLQVEHAPGNNTKARMVLTKRFMESFEEQGIEGWFEACDDKAVLTAICECLGIEFNSKSPIEAIKTKAIKEIQNFGAQIILSRMSVDQLKTCCDEMNLEGWETSSSKRALVAAIITQSAVVKSAAPRQKIITKKRAIEKCTTYDELYQHYPVKALEFWCEKNGLKTYGAKKELINRILEHLSGDKENIVVVPAAQLPTSTKAAKVEKPKTAGTRGRPKKTVEQDDQEDQEPVAEKTKSTKTRVDKAKAAKEVVDEDEQSAEESVEEAPKTKEVPKPKGRGGKAKKPAKEEIEEGEQSVEEAPKAKEIPKTKEAQKSKARGGKAKKAAKKEVDEDEQSAEEPVEAAPKTKVVPKPKGRGGKAKKPAKEEVEEDEQSAEESVEEAPKTKQASKPSSKSAKTKKETVEESANVDDVYDQEAEQRAIDAERQLRVTDEAESEIDIQDSESEDPDHPKSLAGHTVSFLAVTVDLAKAEEAIIKAGGKYKEKLSSSVTIVVTKSSKLERVKAKLSNSKVQARAVPLEFLSNIMN